MSHLYLIRGVPGSGKSTLARGLCYAFISANLPVDMFAADDWFDRYNNGQFDVLGLGNAHQWCLQMTKDALALGKIVLVHNTFTTERELKPYLDYAKEHNHRVTVMVVENRHGNKSVHNVPEEKVNQMRERLRGSIQL